MQLGRGCRDEIEAVLLVACHRQVAFDPAARPAHLRERDQAGLAREGVRAEPVEQAFRAGAGEAVLGEARLVEQAGAGTDCAALLADRVEPVPAPERVFVPAHAVAREPERPFPAEAGPVDGAATAQPLVERVGLQRPSRRQLLLGEVDRVLPLVDLGGPGDEVRRRRGVASEAADIELPHVVAGLPVDDPLRCVAAGAAREDDPEDAEACEDVEVLEARHRPHQAASVGRIAVGAVDDLLDPGRGEGGDAGAGGGEHALDPVEVRREQARVEIRRDPVERPGPRPALERSDEQARPFLPDVVGLVGIAKDGQLAVAAAQLLDRVGDDVVVLEGDDRQLDPGQCGRAARAHWPAALTTTSARTRPAGVWSRQPPRSRSIPVTGVCRRISASVPATKARVRLAGST